MDPTDRQEALEDKIITEFTKIDRGCSRLVGSILIIITIIYIIFFRK